MGKHLMISSTGFPGTNKTWRFVQDAFKEPLNALAIFCGDKVIVSGMEITANSVANGFITYNGEIIPFVGGDLESTVSIFEVIENVAYNVDTDSDGNLDLLPGYKTRYAQCGNGGNIGSFPFSDLTRLKTAKELSAFSLPAGIVIDTNYVHTDNNFTLALLNHLNSIEQGAEVNVQADWAMTTQSSDAYIKNKPFNDMLFVHGSMTSSGGNNGQNQNNYSIHRVYIYPPSGYSISNLAGFIPSIAEIFFAGAVDSNDTLWCKYQVEYSNNRIVVICNNSESRWQSRINYLAIWKK